MFKVMLRFEPPSSEFKFDFCGCVVANGPNASCKDIVSVCYVRKSNQEGRN